MQEYNSNDEVIGAMRGKMEDLFKSAEDKMADGKVDHVVIGNLPKVGKVFTLYGLRYEVIEVHADGHIVLKMLGTK